MLGVHERARAEAALEVYYTNPDGSGYHLRQGWHHGEVALMHHALEAPDLDSAMVAFGIGPDSAWMCEPGQYEQNRETIAELRQLLGAG